MLPSAVETNHSQYLALQHQWFGRLEYFYQAITETSQLDCATHCSGRCCPHPVPDNDENYLVGAHVVVLLPFELEYLVDKAGVDPDQFIKETIEIAPGLDLDIGVWNKKLHCPFFTSDHQCSIHEIRPFDCRSYPLMPFFNVGNSISFLLENECPSVKRFSPRFQDQLKELWLELLAELPESYRLLYNRL